MIAFLEQFNVDACGFSRESNFELLSASMFITPLVAVGVLLIEGIAAVLLLRLGRRIWWVLAIGTVVVISGYLVAHVLNGIATGVA